MRTPAPKITVAFSRFARGELETTEVSPREFLGETRRWLSVATPDLRIEAFMDTGASRTVLGSIGLQLAAATGTELLPGTDRKVRVSGERSLTTAGNVDQTFEMVVTSKDIRLNVDEKEERRRRRVRRASTAEGRRGTKNIGDERPADNERMRERVWAEAPARADDAENERVQAEAPTRADDAEK